MASNAGSHRNMSFQRSQRIICGGPNNWVLDIEISEEGYFYVGNRPKQFSGRESDGQRLVYVLQRREVLVVFGAWRKIIAHFVPANIGVSFWGRNEIFWGECKVEGLESP
jgi:hypothetical protein